MKPINSSCYDFCYFWTCDSLSLCNFFEVYWNVELLFKLQTWEHTKRLRLNKKLNKRRKTSNSVEAEPTLIERLGNPSRCSTRWPTKRKDHLAYIKFEPMCSHDWLNEINKIHCKHNQHTLFAKLALRHPYQFCVAQPASFKANASCTLWSNCDSSSRYDVGTYSVSERIWSSRCSTTNTISKSVSFAACVATQLVRRHKW